MSAEKARDAIDDIREELRQIRIAMKFVVGRYRDNIMRSIDRIESSCDAAQRHISTIAFRDPSYRNDPAPFIPDARQ